MFVYWKVDHLEECWHHMQVDQVSGLKKNNIAAEYLSSTQPASVKAKVGTTRSISSAF